MSEKESKVENKNVMHVASLCLGIISICMSLFWYVSLPTGVLAIVFGVKSARRTGSKMGKAGMITGIVGLSLFVLIYVSFLLLILASKIYY